MYGGFALLAHSLLVRSIAERNLKPGHLKEESQRFILELKTKDFLCFYKRTNKIHYSTMQPLKTLKPFEVTLPLRKQRDQ